MCHSITHGLSSAKIKSLYKTYVWKIYRGSETDSCDEVRNNFNNDKREYNCENIYVYGVLRTAK